VITQINHGALHFFDESLRIYTQAPKVLIMGFSLYQVDDLNEAEIECEL